MTQRLIEAAKAVVDYFEGEYWCIDVLSEAISDAEQQAADDALPITIEWCASQWNDSSLFRNSKVFEIFDSISVVFNACAGGWGEPELIIGKTNVPRIKTRGQLRRLIAALKGGES